MTNDGKLTSASFLFGPNVYELDIEKGRAPHEGLVASGRHVR